MCSNYPGDRADLDSMFALDDDRRDREPFVPDYTPAEGVRIHRQRLHPSRGGTAEVTFRGDLDATRCWISTGSSGRASLYAEVDQNVPVKTRVKVALVPTGKRVPTDGFRLGQAGRIHVYLLEVESTPRGDQSVAVQAAQDAVDLLERDQVVGYPGQALDQSTSTTSSTSTTTV